jgi:hypothetical protein
VGVLSSSYDTVLVEAHTAAELVFGRVFFFFGISLGWGNLRWCPSLDLPMDEIKFLPAAFDKLESALSTAALTIHRENGRLDPSFRFITPSGRTMLCAALADEHPFKVVTQSWQMITITLIFVAYLEPPWISAPNPAM